MTTPAPLPCGRTAMVAVETASGPHVTPQAFAAAGGHAWLVTPRRSAKARALRDRPRVALLFTDGGDALLATGTAKLLGATDLARLGPLLALAGSDYLARNGTLVAGIGTDVLLGSAIPPTDRVLVRVTTQQHRQLGTGPFDVEIDVDVGRGEPNLDMAVDDVALGLLTAAGPVLVPAAWDADAGIARVRAADLDLVDAPDRMAACLTLSSSPGTRPSSFSGVLLRGELHRSRTAARLLVRRRSWWDGYDTGSTTA